jgi:hypothetical protein
MLSIEKLEHVKLVWRCTEVYCRATPRFRLRVYNSDYFLCADHAHEFYRAVRAVVQRVLSMCWWW